MKRSYRLPATIAALASLPLAIGAQAKSHIGPEAAVVPHREFAEAFLSARGLSFDDEPSSVDIEALIEAEYVRLDVGLYDLRFPIEDLAEEDSAENLRDVVVALLDSQLIFIEWVEAAAGEHDDARDDIDDFRDWAAKWSTTRMERAAKNAKDGDLIAALDPHEDLLASIHRLRDWMRAGGPVGLTRTELLASRMMLMPTRPRFLQWACFAGWYYPWDREKFWDSGLGTWLGCRVANTQLLALQFASPDISEGDFELGLPLNYKHPTVMEQHAVHFATQALFDNYYGDRLPGFFSTGLATNLVIQQFGEVDTRIEGDLRARFTVEMAVFVPGGNSGGGVLPPSNPDGRWRQNKGREHFVEMLHQAQDDGSDHTRRSSEKRLHFAILDDDYREDMSVMAPFLGEPAVGKTLPPQAFLGDYREFYRAYKSGFCWWLQSEAGGSRKGCAKAFASVFVDLAQQPEVGFDQVLREIYDVPLSEPEPDKRSLEGRFLSWLFKQ